MQIKAGARLHGAADKTEIIVVKAPSGDVDLRCGGLPLLAAGEQGPEDAAVSPAFAEGTALGKRYEDTESGIEVLCTKPGQGSLSVGDRPLTLHAAKPLPASD
jgi:hypothetical protein